MRIIRVYGLYAYMAYTRIICTTYLSNIHIDYVLILKAFPLFSANYMWRKSASDKKFNGYRSQHCEI